MKASDAIAQYLRDEGIRHVYTISGGANLHIIDSLCQTDGIGIVCPQHEQAAGFAADACARINGLGCALVTSGPGATNLITAIAASYYDSVPVLYITGNQTRDRCNAYGTRQYGFQATPIVEIVREITKWAVQVLDADRLVPTLARAVYIAQSLRRGPVLVDVCDDLQRAEIP